MYTYAYIHITYVQVGIYVIILCVYMFMCIYLCEYIHIHVVLAMYKMCIYVDVCVWVCACAYVCVCVCVHVCLSLYVCTYCSYLMWCIIVHRNIAIPCVCLHMWYDFCLIALYINNDMIALGKFWSCFQMTPNHDFFLDYHPQHHNIIIGAGFSGMQHLQ